MIICLIHKKKEHANSNTLSFLRKQDGEVEKQDQQVSDP